MQYLVEVDDKKAKFFQEMLKHLRFAKAKPLTKANVQFINELQQSIDEVKLAKKGKIKLIKAQELIDGL